MTKKSADINYISRDLFPKTYNRTMIDDDYIKQVDRENQSLKDKIEKVIDYLNKIELDNYDIYTANILLDRNDDLLEILKGE